MFPKTARIARSTLVLGALVGAIVPWPGIAAPARGPVSARSPADDEDPAGARVIVKVKAQGSLVKALSARGAFAGPQVASTLAARYRLALRDGHAIEGRSQVIHGDKSLTSAELATRLAADPDVEYAVPDLRRHALALPNDPLFAASASISPEVGQWYLRAPDATAVSAINAPAAWAITTGTPAIVVADLDTGVRFDHPDLANKLLAGRNFVSANGVTGTGWSADASDPGDWTTAGQCGAGEPATPSSWHGTQVAGLIGAQTDNGLGMASIGYQVRVLPVRVLGSCGGYDSDIVAAMLWAGGVASNPVANPTPARVINLSLGGTGSCTTAYVDAMNQLTAVGVVVVAAAGNQEGSAVGTPANCPGVIAVTGVRQVGTKVGFSSIGPEVAIAAPGGNCVNLDTPPNSGLYPPSLPCEYPILTTTNYGRQGPATNGYTSGTNTDPAGPADITVGTSFATPLVSGTAALMLAANPALTPARVKSTLQGAARAFPIQPAGSTVPVCQPPSAVAQDECYCTTSTCGAGLLDAGAAVAAAAAGATPYAAIQVASATVTAGSSVDFDASGSLAPAGRTIASYRWAITSGSAIAAFSGATDGATATVATSGAGSFTVQLTVTDSIGATGTAAVTVSAAAPGGGGGGAVGGGWLLALAAATAALAWPRRRSARTDFREADSL